MADSEPTTPSTDLVRRYLDRLVAHDWEAVSACLAERVVRVGPFGDTYSGRKEYVAFLRGLMPTLPGYAMRLDRVLEAGSPESGSDRAGATVLAELTESVAMDGVPVDTAEALVFEVDQDHLIAHVAIYIQSTPRR